MKYVKRMALCLAGILSAFAAQAEPAPEKIHQLAQQVLAAYGTDAALVEAVKAQNAAGRSADEVKAIDTKWMATPGVDDFMTSIMQNAASKRLAEIAGSHAYLSEVFLMDNQGANVAMTDKTSDFWQGDEAKFVKSFAGGAGAVFVDEVKFDDSTQVYLVQVSVPVVDGGKAIGAITFGVDVEKAE